MGNQSSKIQTDNTEIRKFSHFPSNDVKEWSMYIKARYPDGNLSQNDVENIFKSFFPFGNVRRFSHRLFATMNIGGTGFVDFNELLIAFSILVKGSDFEKLRWIFRFYDKDRDGVVSKDEMYEAVNDLVEMVNDSIAIGFEPKACVDSIFASLNNSSGFLTFNDFEKLAEINGESFGLISLFSD